MVDFIGIKSGYGKYIRLRHSRDYGTAYGHMSRFARDVRRGSHVQQGQVIGYVGATGLATGPHLHYEVLKDGDQINPMSLKTMVADALTGPSFSPSRRRGWTSTASAPPWSSSAASPSDRAWKRSTRRCQGLGLGRDCFSRRA